MRSGCSLSAGEGGCRILPTFPVFSALPPCQRDRERIQWEHIPRETCRRSRHEKNCLLLQIPAPGRPGAAGPDGAGLCHHGRQPEELCPGRGPGAGRLQRPDPADPAGGAAVLGPVRPLLRHQLPAQCGARRHQLQTHRQAVHPVLLRGHPVHQPAH